MDSGQLDSAPLDPAAVADLYARHAAELRAFLLAVLRNADAAAEALQSTFVKAAEAGRNAQPETIKGWLFRVAYNQAMLIRRKDAVDQRATRQAAWQLKPEMESADAAFIRREDIERIRQGLETLPADQRQVVRLRIYDNKTFAEIAQELGLPPGTVASRMRAALQKLNQELGEL